MSLMIKNKTRQLMTVTLNSGETLHLAPGEVSQPLSEIETANNTKIQRLSNEGRGRGSAPPKAEAIIRSRGASLKHSQPNL
jgi:hypothetical protein